MKKLLSLMFVLCLLATLSACGSIADKPETPPSTGTIPVEPTTPNTATESTTPLNIPIQTEEENAPVETTAATEAPTVDNANTDDPYYYITVAEKMNLHFEKELIEIEHIEDYFDGDNIRAKYNDWITLILAVDNTSKVVTEISFRAEPGDAPSGSPWILVLLSLVEDLVDFSYPDNQIGAEVFTHYEKTLYYNSTWNWPSYESDDSYYNENGVQCELYRAVGGLVFKVALP